ncbi:MAG: Hsp70 family protein [Candidatus Aminicenantes bacterium]|nr:Hsp70 family protein [Candidatus Aminicenantes bacterium]
MNRNYISLDLGSETMAAFCQLYGKPERKRINLQEFAPILVDFDGQDIDYLLIERNGKKEKSKRLRTLIALMDQRQPEDIPDSHALLDFVDEKGNLVVTDGEAEYKKSLFEYFYKKEQAYSRVVLPNPKIPFQEGAGEIIPIIETTYKKYIRYSPEKLFQHLITQIIRNFVLKSSEYRNRKIKDEDGQDIDDHLILTIPNVFSLTHAENIKDYVIKITGIKNVDIIYESDAVAYYVMDAIDEETQFNNFRTSLKKNLKNNPKRDFQILTFDIGHGTTDLSLIEINEPKGQGKADRRTFYVKARAGKSHGGSRLNYIFAEYYNRCLREVLSQPKFKSLDPRFDFLHARAQVGVKLSTQGPIIEALENLIVAVKKNMNENYTINLSFEKQAEYIDKLVDKWLDAIDTNWKEKPETEKEKMLYNNFRNELKNIFFIGEFPGCFKILFGFHSQRLIELKSKIETYVKENVEELLMNLGDIAVAREIKTFPRKKSLTVLSKMIREIPTAVVIAGQASQFKPIQEAIRKSFTVMNFLPAHLIFLKDETAKEACSRGAIIYKDAGHLWANREELHGTYGFMCTIHALDYEFKTLDMKALNEGEDVVINFAYLSSYWFFYSPRASHTFTQENPPRFFDGSTALISCFPDTKEFRVKYLKDQRLICINDKHKFKIASYGKITESIYPKVWPAVLKPLD